MKSLLFPLILLVALTACSDEPDSSQSEASFVNVTGMGEIEAEPDMAILTISSNAKEANATQAKKVADERYQRVLKVLKKAGVPDKRIKVTSLSIQPEYDWRNNERVYKGERVSRRITVKVHDLEKVSPLIQALVEQGVSTVDDMRTGFIDQKGLQKEAMVAATKDAKQKADFLAEQLDRDLGVAYQIQEHSNNVPLRRQPEFRSLAAASSADAPPEMFGTQAVRASINVRFKLK